MAFSSRVFDGWTLHLCCAGIMVACEQVISGDLLGLPTESTLRRQIVVSWLLLALQVVSCGEFGEFCALVCDTLARLLMARHAFFVGRSKILGQNYCSFGFYFAAQRINYRLQLQT